MKRSMGKCLALIMALTMLFSLAACSSGGKEPKKDDTQPTNTGGDTAKGDEGETPDTAGENGAAH